MSRTVLFGPDDTPMLVDESEGDKMRSLLVETFGLLTGLSEPEYAAAGVTPQQMLTTLVDQITRTVGIERLEARFEAQGLKIQAEPVVQVDSVPIGGTVVRG